MKCRFLILVSLGALIFVTSGGRPTFAHHSASATYIHGKLVKIEGTLKEFLWRNPHSFMTARYTRAGDNHCSHTGSKGALNDLFPIIVK